MADLSNSFQTVSDHNLKNTSVIENLSFDIFEISVLRIMRYFCEAVDQPARQTWKLAFREAEKIFPVPYGATIAHAISVAIDMVCVSRARNFCYFQWNSLQAKDLITDEERYFLMTLHNIRRGKKSAARSYAMMVSEGPQFVDFLAALERIGIITGDVESPDFN